MNEWLSKLEIFNSDGTPGAREDAPLLDAMHGEKLLGLEEIRRHPRTGELRHRLVNVSPLRSSSGHILGAIATIRGITERKSGRRRVYAELMTNWYVGLRNEPRSFAACPYQKLRLLLSLSKKSEWRFLSILTSF